MCIQRSVPVRVTSLTFRRRSTIMTTIAFVLCARPIGACGWRRKPFVVGRQRFHTNRIVFREIRERMEGTKKKTLHVSPDYEIRSTEISAIFAGPWRICVSFSTHHGSMVDREIAVNDDNDCCYRRDWRATDRTLDNHASHTWTCMIR